MLRILFLSIAGAIIILSGCSRTESSHTHSHGEHSENKASREMDEFEHHTVYADNYELFVKFNPLIAGKESNFDMYISRYPGNKPVENGSLTTMLIQGKQGIRISSSISDAKGIVFSSLKPDVTGKGFLQFDLMTDSSVVSFKIDGIIVHANEEEADANLGEFDMSNKIHFKKTDSWQSEFDFSLTKKSNFNEIIKTTGAILPAQGDEIVISAMHSGLIVFAEKDLIAGKEVMNGQHLFTLSTKGLIHDNYEANYSDAKVNYEKALSEFERSKILNKDQIISEKEFVRIKSEYETAKTKFETLQKNYIVGGQKIVSPDRGFIKNVFVSEGQFVETGQPIASIAKNRNLIIKADVPQEHFKCLRDIISANFLTPYDNRTYSIEELNGKLISYGKNADITSFYTPVYFEVDNSGDLISGTYIEIYLKSKSIENILTVPKSALMEEMGDYFVYVMIGAEYFEKRYIKTGMDNGLETEVISGLQEGEKVVSSGAYRIKLASLSGALPDPHAGHSH